MQHHAASGILLVKISSQTAHKDHREFQSLALVDTHNAHDVLILPDHVRLAKIDIVFLEFIDVAHKMKQSLVARILIGDRLLHQHAQIRPASGSCRHRRRIISVAAFLQHDLDQLVNRGVRHKRPQPLIQLPELPQFFLITFRQRFFTLRKFPAACEHTLTERHAAVVRPKPSQLLVRKPGDRRLKHCRKRNILSRIVENPKHRQHCLYLHRRKIAGCGHRMRRDSRLV